MNDLEWREAVEAVKNGDKKAFEKLYRETERAVYFTCLKLLANEEGAMDAMQDTFMTALSRLGTLDDGAKFPMWINRIAVNKCRDSFRRVSVDSFDEQLEQGADFKDDEKFIPEEYVTDETGRKLIMYIINEVLSDVQRQSVIMYYYDDMSLEEIAEVMECPVKTVSSRLCSARDKIKEAVLIYEKENDDRLHMIVPIPILTQILIKEASGISVPDIAPMLLASEYFAASAASASALTTTAIAGGSTKMGGILTGKVIAAIAAGVIAVGGTTAAVVLSKNADDTSSKTSVSASDSESVKDTESENESKVTDSNYEDGKAHSDESSSADSKSQSGEYFFVKGYRTSDTLTFLLPQTVRNDPIKQVATEGRYYWGEYYDTDTKGDPEIKNVAYKFSTFAADMIKRPEGQSNLEFYKDFIFETTNASNYFSSWDIESTPKSLEVTDQETIKVLDGSEALRFKGYLLLRVYDRENRQYNELKYYCEGFLGEYKSNLALSENRRKCYMCISWCANETDENKEKVKALIDASAKELTYEKKSREEMERKVIKINLNP